MEQMEGADAERKGKKKEVKWKRAGEERTNGREGGGSGKWKGKRIKTQGNGGIVCSSDNWSGERRCAAGVDTDEI